MCGYQLCQFVCVFFYFKFQRDSFLFSQILCKYVQFISIQDLEVFFSCSEYKIGGYDFNVFFVSKFFCVKIFVLIFLNFYLGEVVKFSREKSLNFI